jgi:hypothetical protein
MDVKSLEMTEPNERSRGDIAACTSGWTIERVVMVCRSLEEPYNSFGFSTNHDYSQYQIPTQIESCTAMVPSLFL